MYLMQLSQKQASYTLRNLGGHSPTRIRKINASHAKRKKKSIILFLIILHFLVHINAESGTGLEMND